MSSLENRVGKLEAASIAAGTRPWIEIVQAALNVPLDQIPAPKWLREQMLSELDADRPDLARQCRDGLITPEQGNDIMLRERFHRPSAYPPPDPEPLPAWLVAEQRVRGTSPEPSYTAHQGGAFDLRAERQAQWRAEEEHLQEQDRAEPVGDLQAERQQAAWQAEQRRMAERERVRQAGYGPTQDHRFGPDW